MKRSHASRIQRGYRGSWSGAGNFLTRSYQINCYGLVGYDHVKHYLLWLRNVSIPDQLLLYPHSIPDASTIESRSFRPTFVVLDGQFSPFTTKPRPIPGTSTPTTLNIGTTPYPLVRFSLRSEIIQANSLLTDILCYNSYVLKQRWKICSIYKKQIRKKWYFKQEGQGIFTSYSIFSFFFLYAKLVTFCRKDSCSGTRTSNTNPLYLDLLSLYRRPTYVVPPTTTIYPRSMYPKTWGAEVAEWLSSWLAEQEDRGSIPGLATWIFRDWLSPASKMRYRCKIAQSTLILKTTNQPSNNQPTYENLEKGVIADQLQPV